MKSGSRLPDGSEAKTSCPAGIVHPGDLDVGGGDARDRGVHDRQPAQQLLDRGADGVGIVADGG